MAAAIEGVIFDLDGLLLDTEPAYKIALQKVLDRYGKTYEEALRKRVIGRDELLGCKLIIEQLELPLTPAELREERAKLLPPLFAECDLLPGAERITRHLASKGIPIAVATSSPQSAVEVKTKRHRQWFEAVFSNRVVCGNQVERAKPFPDIFLAAAKMINVDPARCLVFEDAPSGTQAGKAAGMKVVAVPDPCMDRSMYEQADLILDSLEQFDPTAFGLPGY